MFARHRAGKGDGQRNGYAAGRRRAGRVRAPRRGDTRRALRAGPVREALRRLAAEGLVEIVPHRGALVRRLTKTQALELFDIRTELEALAARRAAARIAEACVRERFERDTAPIWRKTPRYSTADYLAENRSFHAAIYLAAGNGELARLDRQMQLSLLLSQISPALSAGAIESSLAEHRAIADAILAADAAAADMASRAHMARATALVVSMPAELFRKERPAEILLRS